MRTLIVDDEAIARARLRALCAGLPDRVNVVGEAASGSEALSGVEDLRPDLLLLDIAMPDLDGMDVARALERLPSPPAVVFCTAFPGHALEAFDLSAIDYLLKPVSRERLERAITRVARSREASTAEPREPVRLDHLWVPHREGMVRVELADVERIEAEGDYVRLVTGRSSYLLHATLAHLQSRLDADQFVRLRRSVIVRADLLKGVEHVGGGTWNVILSDGSTVRAGPTYWQSLKQRLMSG